MNKQLILLHLPEKLKFDQSQYSKMLKSIVDQMNVEITCIIAGEIALENKNFLIDQQIEFQHFDYEKNKAFLVFKRIINEFYTEHFLYIDARQNPVYLKNACLQTLSISAERNQDASLFYSDYELNDGEDKKEIKLLFHHLGRVRDNQDYGKVFYIKKQNFNTVDGFNPNIKFNMLYDLRLKLSEKGKLIRIGNKYSGSLYTVEASQKSSNVFDYLLSSKDVQIEAEEVLTAHLKRINAFLAPGSFAPKAPREEKPAELDASVIIPVGFRPEFIGTAIESIQSQSCKNIEAIIVVNGGEKDPTAKEVKRYMKGGDLFDPDKPEIRLIQIDINNIGLCLNIGSQNARGKYYVQLDSDDRLKSDAVEKIISVFESDPSIGMVIGSYEVWEKKEDGKLYRMDEIPVVTHDEWTEANGRNNLLRINGAGAPRSIPIPLIKAMGYFSINDDAYARNYGEDYEMVNKIAEHYRIGRIYDPIYEVVRHSGGTDHAISQDLIDRNDEAKDDMRKEAILRRKKIVMK